jgi:hypothetical protein
MVTFCLTRLIEYKPGHGLDFCERSNAFEQTVRTFETLPTENQFFCNTGFFALPVMVNQLIAMEENEVAF